MLSPSQNRTPFQTIYTRYTTKTFLKNAYLVLYILLFCFVCGISQTIRCFFYFVNQDREELEEHQFSVGEKLEALHPQDVKNICPFTVVDVPNSYYFIIQIDEVKDDGSDKVKMCCHANSHNIFPAKWCQQKGLKLTPPVGKLTIAILLFTIDMKLGLKYFAYKKNLYGIICCVILFMCI